MVPRKSPPPLFGLSLSASADLVSSACTVAFLNHGGYGSEECAGAIDAIQSFLVAQLPNTVFERLAEERNGGLVSASSGARCLGHPAAAGGVGGWARDARIKLAVFLHPSLTKFSVDAKGNELMQATAASAASHDGDGVVDGFDELFWHTQLRRLTNLVSLSLNLIATDDILVLVGESCPKLEIVNIISRIKQEVHPHFSNMPAVSLKFCVTDVGLRAIMKCKNLRRVVMNKIINQDPTGNQCMSLRGVRALVRGLPKLEFISFGSLGKVLQGEEFSNILPVPSVAATGDEKQDPIHRPLRLRYFSELDPSFVDVSRLQLLCPNLQHLSLSVPISFNGSAFVSVSSSLEPCNRVLRALAGSALPLRVLELQHFPYGEHFKDLLRKKGSGLEELLFRANGNLHSEHVSFIGTHCPNLQRLHLKELGPEESPVFAADLEKLLLFPRLSHLHLSGRVWNPSILLPLLLSASPDLAQMSLLNMSYRPVMDAAFERLLGRGRLRRLESLQLYSGCFLSLAVIRRLVLSPSACPRLRSLSFLQFEAIETADVEALRAEAVAGNLDIKICCLELFVE